MIVQGVLIDCMCKTILNGKNNTIKLVKITISFKTKIETFKIFLTFREIKRGSFTPLRSEENLPSLAATFYQLILNALSFFLSTHSKTQPSLGLQFPNKKQINPKQNSPNHVFITALGFHQFPPILNQFMQ